MSHKSKKENISTPSQSPETSKMLGPVFRVGNPEMSADQMIEGKRFFNWRVSDDDVKVAELAGWGHLDYQGFDHPSGITIGRIELPANLRSGSSVLSGVEAWEGEKDGLLSTITGFVKSVHDKHKAIDTNLTLDSVAVARGNNNKGALFMPPHQLANDPAVIQEWVDTFKNDMEVVLDGDPLKETLLRHFERDTSYLLGANREQA